MFFGMPQALYPFLAYNWRAEGLGLLYAARPSARCSLPSAPAGRVASTARPHGDHRGGGWGVGIVGVGLSHTLWLTLKCLAFAGAADMVSGIFGRSSGARPSDHLRGRLAGTRCCVHDRPLSVSCDRSDGPTRLGVSGSIWVGGVLCIEHCGLAAACEVRPLQRRGRHGPQTAEGRTPGGRAAA